MKIAELLQEIQYHPFRKSPDEGGRNAEIYQRYRDNTTGIGAYYNDELKKPFGLSGEWLMTMGAKRSDIKPAMEKARQSDEYAKLLDLGFKEETTKRDASNGTFHFTATRAVLPKDLDEVDPDARYRILVYGRISGYATGGFGPEKQSKLVSPPPHTVRTHPDMSPVDRLAETYKASMARLYKVQAPKFLKAFKDRIKKETQ